MIKVQNLTPEIYSKQSRDFQFIGRLYDIIFNYVKTNSANLYTLPIGKNMNEQLLNLLALTLGFKARKNYNSKQLLAICSVLPQILKHKGSLNSVLIATNALLTSNQIAQALDYTIIPKKGIILYVSQELADLTLLTDLLDYILPAGMSCSLVKENQEVIKIKTTIGISDLVTVYDEKSSIELSTIANSQNPLSNLSFGTIQDTAGIMQNTSIVNIGQEEGETEDE